MEKLILRMHMTDGCVRLQSERTAKFEKLLGHLKSLFYRGRIFESKIFDSFNVEHFFFLSTMRHRVSEPETAAARNIIFFIPEEKKSLACLYLFIERNKNP